MRYVLGGMRGKRGGDDDDDEDEDTDDGDDDDELTRMMQGTKGKTSITYEHIFFISCSWWDAGEERR